MSESHNSVGDRGSNVGSHDHVNGLAGSNRLGSDQRHHNGGGGGRGLEQDSGKNTNHESGNGVGVVSQEFSGSASSDNLGRGTEEVESEQKKVEEKAQCHDPHSDPGPLLGGVAATGMADLAPGGIGNVFLLQVLRLLSSLGGFLLIELNVRFFRGLKEKMEQNI